MLLQCETKPIIEKYETHDIQIYSKLKIYINNILNSLNPYNQENIKKYGNVFGKGDPYQLLKEKDMTMENIALAMKLYDENVIDTIVTVKNCDIEKI